MSSLPPEGSPVGMVSLLSYLLVYFLGLMLCLYPGSPALFTPLVSYSVYTSWVSYLVHPQAFSLVFSLGLLLCIYPRSEEWILL